MLVLVIVLAITNVLSLGALAYLYLEPIEAPGPDPTAGAALDRSPRPPGAVGPASERRLISIEILNPIELAGTRGRLAGIAGTLVPGLTRRIVYDQTLKIVKEQLEQQQVVADVRLHTLRPVRDDSATVTGVEDRVQKVDLDEIPVDGPAGHPDDGEQR